MPDIYSPDNSPPIVLKLWVLTRVIKIAIKLCSWELQWCAGKKVKIVRIWALFASTLESRRRNNGGRNIQAFSISRSGFTLWPFRPALSLGANLARKLCLQLALAARRNKRLLWTVFALNGGGEGIFPTAVLPSSAGERPDLLVFKECVSYKIFCKGQVARGGKFTCNKLKCLLIGADLVLF